MLCTVVLAGASLTPRPEATTRALTTIQVTEQQGRWTTFAGIDDLGDGHPPYFIISGTIRNAGHDPVRFVKLRYELLDDFGTVLASEYGYNHGAEDLRRPEYDHGPVPADVDVPILPPGEADTFRMMFFRSDVPRFANWQVRVIEVAPR